MSIWFCYTVLLTQGLCHTKGYAKFVTHSLTVRGPNVHTRGTTTTAQMQMQTETETGTESGTETETRSIRRGFNSIVPLHYLYAFTADELVAVFTKSKRGKR